MAMFAVSEYSIDTQVTSTTSTPKQMTAYGTAGLKQGMSYMGKVACVVGHTKRI